MSRTFSRLVTLGTALLVSLALALPAFAYDPPPPSGTSSNTTNQTAANTAYVTISAVAISGDATGYDEVKAKSGDAEVFVANEQEQLNVQAVASGVIGNCGCESDFGPDSQGSHDPKTCGCPATAVDNATQTADNYAQATIEATATSGNAKASEKCDDVVVGSAYGGRYDKTEAESGDATVTILSEQEQANLQLALNFAIPTIEKHGHGPNNGPLEAASFDHEKNGATAENTSTQTAANTAYATLTGEAWSGDAFAEGWRADAESGDADVFVRSEQKQLNAQAIANLAFPLSSKNKSTQKAEGNYAQAGIDGLAWSGNAKAFDSKEVESGDSEVAACNEQEQASLQLVLTVNGIKVRCY